MNPKDWDSSPSFVPTAHDMLAVLVAAGTEMEAGRLHEKGMDDFRNGFLRGVSWVLANHPSLIPHHEPKTDQNGYSIICSTEDPRDFQRIAGPFDAEEIPGHLFQQHPVHYKTCFIVKEFTSGKGSIMYTKLFRYNKNVKEWKKVGA